MTEAASRSSLTKMNPWSRSSSMAIASISVSCSKPSWIAAPDRLDELEELLGLPFGFADDEDVREDLVVALVQLVEEHVDSIVRPVGSAVYGRVR